jgi:hypothetical protein
VAGGHAGRGERRRGDDEGAAVPQARASDGETVVIMLQGISGAGSGLQASRRTARKVDMALSSVCVFCGSAFGGDPVYAEAARTVGRDLAAAGLTLVYGGGGVGLMGTVAREALARGGRVVGVIPRFLRQPEIVLGEAELVEVDSMHQRKQQMFERSDAFVVLPGGVGTLEEAIELLSWGRLNLHRKPVVFVDVRGYWRPLLELIDHTIAEGFTPAGFRDLYGLVEDPSAVVPYLQLQASIPGQPATPLALI